MPFVAEKDGLLYAHKLEYNLADHCNLSCRECSHLSPYVRKNFVPIDTFTRDLFRLAEVYRVQRFRPLASVTADSAVVDALTSKLLELVGERLKQGFQIPIHLLKQTGEVPETEGEELPRDFVLKHGLEFLSKLNDPEQIADLVACTLLSNPLERQKLLETVDLETRLKHLIQFLVSEIHLNRKEQN